MASLLINSIDISCILSSNFLTTIEYRVSGSGSYIISGTADTNTDGTFVSPYIINGLLDNTCYDIRFSSSEEPLCPYVETFCIGSGTTTTSTSTSTSSTTTTTTQSFCMSIGFPIGNIYGALYWADSYTDTSTNEDCDGDTYFMPSDSRAVWIAFFSDSLLTTPVITSLNNYPIVVDSSAVFIGDGTPQIAYFVGVYPYSGTAFTGYLCETYGYVNDLPTLSSSTCFLISNTISTPASGTIARASGDSSTNGYFWDFRESIFEASQVDGGTLSGALGVGEPGPSTSLNFPVYGNVTLGNDAGTWLPVIGSTGVQITIVGKANDGTNSEIINIPSFTLSSTALSTKRFYVDGNHPITITFNEIF